MTLQEHYVQKLREILANVPTPMNHIEADKLLVSVLRDLDFLDLVNLYEEASEHFWYE